MALAVELAPEIALELDRFESQVTDYLEGRLDEEVFRPIRLTNGIYGIRQGNNLQMVRVKIPHGRVNAEQLDMLAHIAEEYGRGFGHITTRQNVQLHFVPLERTPDAMRLIASVGMTTREACGDTVRNIVGCPLAGVCRTELFDVTAWARETTKFLLRHPLSQRLPRKFKINFSGCENDCGQGMINDIGAIATRSPDGEFGFKLVVGGGLGANPFPAQLLEPFTPFEDLIITIESILRVFDRTGIRTNHLRARMKWVVDSMGIEDFRQAVFTERNKMRSVVGPLAPHGIPKGLDPDAFGDSERETPAPSIPKRVDGDGYEAWLQSNTIPQRQDGLHVAFATMRLGDLTASQFRAVAGIARNYGSGDIRLTQRQNLAIRDVPESQLPAIYEILESNKMARIGRIRDVVSCPGADTCNLAVTQSRGLAKAVGDHLDAEGLGGVDGISINISGCSNSCGQHHISDIGFMGLERRIDGNSAPGYQLFLGGGIIGEEHVEFGKRTLRVGAKRAPEVVAALVRKYLDERQDGEDFKGWVKRIGAKSIAESLEEIARIRSVADAPDDYVDWDELEQFQVKLGRGECAT
ncbi:MAG: ferredoxin--nitrite reductase [Acidobacteria bacterium]|nr:MAG: ferredoxin--nitrite reductase [Acidobacteriota bacterium]